MARLLAAVATCVLLAGCSDYATVKPVATHVATSVTLPPVGFDHQYGDDPLASRDGFALERQWFAKSQFWEVYLGLVPARAGYFKVGTPAVLRAARHQVTSVTLVLATEQQALMSGLLAYPTDVAQEAWVQSLVTALAQQATTGCAPPTSTSTSPRPTSTRS